MSIWKETKITINRGSWNDQNTFETYYTFLNQSIAPIIKELREQKLIDWYHFVAHNTLDLRLLIKDWKEQETNGILNKYVKQEKIDCQHMMKAEQTCWQPLRLCNNNSNITHIES